MHQESPTQDAETTIKCILATLSLLLCRFLTNSTSGYLHIYPIYAVCENWEGSCTSFSTAIEPCSKLRTPSTRASHWSVGLEGWQNASAITTARWLACQCGFPSLVFDHRLAVRFDIVSSRCPLDIPTVAAGRLLSSSSSLRFLLTSSESRRPSSCAVRQTKYNSIIDYA